MYFSDIIGNDLVMKFGSFRDQLKYLCDIKSCGLFVMQFGGPTLL